MVDGNKCTYKGFVNVDGIATGYGLATAKFSSLKKFTGTFLNNKPHGISKTLSLASILILTFLVMEETSTKLYVRVAEYKNGVKFGKETWYKNSP